jgi:glycyl-tRNA synthetase beta chain
MPDFLLEIGLEEIPARMIASAQDELLNRIMAMLKANWLLDASPHTGPIVARSYSTPRRLAVHITGVVTQQPDVNVGSIGPSEKIAVKDGAYTPAATAFAQRLGITVNDLRIEETPKGRYVTASTTRIGRTAAEVLATELPKEIAALYWAKNMRWLPGSKETFVRPVLWLVCLLGEEIVPITFAGKTAGRATYGHRILSTGEPFEIIAPDSYLAQLEGEYVLADVELRRQKIRKALDHVTRQILNARWREDHALVDAVTHLTEWPDVLLGNFDPAYLTLPEEVLVTVMRDHQKYFAVEDATGKLAPHFLTVTNIALNDENEPVISQGNERVLRARFNDARFFWDFDQRVPLEDRVKLLENVTFQKDLGSYADKSKRVRKIGNELGRIAAMHVVPFDLDAIGEAAVLAKTDLTTELVKEFTELQGIIGGLYAESQGIRTTVADIIYDQYLPAGMDDGVPRSFEGAVFGIADRADTIAGMFRLGMEPTGSKDPFALRRAANGIVKILAETGVALSIDNIITMSAGTDDNNVAVDNDVIVLNLKTADKMRAFFKERVEFYLREVRGFAYDVVAAILAQPIDEKYGSNSLPDLVARAEAISSMRGSEDFQAVSAAFRRMKNILTQAHAKRDIASSIVDHDLLLDPAEKLLALTAGAAASALEVLQGERNYSEALRVIAALRPSIDDFFDKVMVMAPEPDIRANRLALLNRTLNDLSKIADFSEIVTAG